MECLDVFSGGRWTVWRHILQIKLTYFCKCDKRVNKRRKRSYCWPFFNASGSFIDEEKTLAQISCEKTAESVAIGRTTLQIRLVVLPSFQNFVNVSILPVFFGFGLTFLRISINLGSNHDLLSWGFDQSRFKIFLTIPVASTIATIPKHHTTSTIAAIPRHHPASTSLG